MECNANHDFDQLNLQAADESHPTSAMHRMAARIGALMISVSALVSVMAEPLPFCAGIV